MLIERICDGRLPALVMFDLDGTLVDSLTGLTAALNAMLKHYQRPLVNSDHVRGWIGRGAPVLVAQALRYRSQGPDVTLDDALAYFLLNYEKRMMSGCTLYQGVQPTLEWFSQRSVRLAVVTNKPERFIAPLLQQLGIADYFVAWLGGDSLVAAKPDPLPLQTLLQRFCLSPADALMVGDSEHDVQAARAAGCKVVAVSYGYGSPASLRQAAADEQIDTLAALLSD